MSPHIIVFWIIAGILTACVVLLLLRPLGNKRIAFAIIGFVPATALGLYLYLGRPDLTEWRTRENLPPFIAASVEKLIADTQEHPNDIQAWVLLGDVYGRIKRYSDAADAYQHAAALEPKSPLYKAMVGQAVVLQDGGAVLDDSLIWFNQASSDSTTRYYLALRKSQIGDWQAALADWQKLKEENPQGMESSIDARITDARTALGMDQH